MPNQKKKKFIPGPKDIANRKMDVACDKVLRALRGHNLDHICAAKWNYWRVSAPYLEPPRQD